MWRFVFAREGMRGVNDDTTGWYDPLVMVERNAKMKKARNTIDWRRPHRTSFSGKAFGTEVIGFKLGETNILEIQAASPLCIPTRRVHQILRRLHP